MQQFYTTIKKKQAVSKYVHYVLLCTMLHATFIAPAQNIVMAYLESKPGKPYYGLQYPTNNNSRLVLNPTVTTNQSSVIAKKSSVSYLTNTPNAVSIAKKYTSFSVKADITSGIIGVSKDKPLDDAKDNLFKFQVGTVPAGSYKAYLSYELQGVQDYSAVSRSINERIATGGYIVKSMHGWSLQKEEIDMNWLRQGENRIMFSIPKGSQYQYQVKNVKISFEPLTNGTFESLLHISSNSLTYSKDNTVYVRGFLKNTSSAALKVFADEVALKVNDGEFEGIITLSEAQKAKKFIIIKAMDDKGFLGQEILTLDTLAEADKAFPIEAYEQKVSRFFEVTAKGKLETDGASILVQPNALTTAKSLTLLKLRNIDIAPMGSGMINVTKGGYGYRFLPDGTTFAKPLSISIGYDEKRIPKGYTTKDIKTFYFDTHSKSWVAVKRDSIDEKEKNIISETTHFTDYINGIIQTPESPETAGFTPTMMNDIKAANPSSEMTLISPPEVSQKGDANVSYPIKIPAGRKGMQPNLAIQYNSDGGSGWLGEGWGISVPAITIDTRWGVPVFDAQYETEMYSLGGEQLMYPKLSNNSDWMPNRHYDAGTTTTVYNTAQRPRIAAAIFTPRKQGSFAKIERLGNNPTDYYWKVTSTDGTISWYGGKDGVNENAVIRNDLGKIVHWALHMTEDVYKNNIIYKYTSQTLANLQGNNANLNGGKTFNLYSIFYTGYNDDFGDYKVIFTNEDQILRKDINISSRLGYKEVTPFRLKNISIGYRDESIRSYGLTYQEGPFSKSLLKEVEEFDDSGNSFYKHTFEYYDDINSRDKGGILFDQPYTVNVPDISPNFTLGIGNLLNASRINAQENVEAEWGIAPTAGIDLLWVSNNPSAILTVGAPFGESTSWGKGKISLNDMDGNGLDDVVYKTNSGLKFLPHYVDSNNNHYFDSTAKNILNVNNFEKSEGWTKTMFGESWDFNALYKFYAGTKRFKSSNKTTTYFTDGNGDGLQDIVVDNQVYFNHIDPNSGDAVFTTGSDVTPNMVITASPAEISTDNIPDENPETATATDYDVVRVWQAPRSGIITIEDALQFIPNGNSKLIYSVETDGNAKVNNAQPFRIYLKAFDQTSTSENILLDDYSGNHPPLGLSVGDPGGNHSGIYVLPGQRFYFRVHRNKTGKNDVLNTNPRIKYVTQQGLYNNLVPQILLDDNNLDVNNASYEEAFVLSDNLMTQVTKNGTVSITWPVINVHDLSDKTTFRITKRVSGQSSAVTNTVIYEQSCAQGNVSTSVDAASNSLAYNLSSIPVTETDDTHMVEFLFEVKADSNVRWKDIEWKPKVVFTGSNTEDNFEKYPVVDYDIYQTLIHRLDLNPTLNGCTFDYDPAHNTNFGDYNNNYQAGWPNSGVQTYSVFPNTHLINTGAGAQLTSSDSGTFMLVVKKEGLTIGKVKVIVSGGQVHMSSSQTLPIPVFTGNLSDPNLQIPKISLQYVVQGENNLKVFKKYSQDVANANPYGSTVCEGNVVIAVGNTCTIDAQGNVTPAIANNYSIYNRIYASVLVKKDPTFGPRYRSWGQFMYNAGLDTSTTTPSDAYGKLINAAIADNPMGASVNFMASALGLNLSNCDNSDAAAAELCAINTLNAALNLPQQSSISSANVEQIVNQIMLNPQLSGLTNVQPPVIKMNALRKQNANNTGFIEKWIGFHDEQYSSATAMRDGNLSSTIGGGIFDDPNDPDTTILQADLYTGMNSLVKDHRSVTRSYAAGWGSTNFSHSQSSYSKDMTDFVDVNGDRYPDLLSVNAVQQSNMTGGHRSSKPHNWSISESDSNNNAITKSRTFTVPGRKKADDDAESDDEGNPAARIGVGVSVNLSGNNKERSYWMDLNGDGLVDKVVSNNGFKYYLNNGNITNFTSSQENFSNLNSSENRPSTLAANISIPITNQSSGSFSFGLSAGIGASSGDADVSFQDINGDGLVDMLEVSNQVAKVRYNNGNGFSDSQYTLSVMDYPAKNLNRNYSGSLSGSISYYYGFSICCWILPIIYFKIGATASGSVSLTVSDTQKTFRDFNGDGFVDYVERDGKNLKVYPSNIRRTNKLKTVTNPLGGSFTLDYKPQRTDYNNPNSKWAMTSIVVNDNYNLENDGKDSSRKEFAYLNGKYDRREREFYGYETVKQMEYTTDINEAPVSIYRTTVTKYHNANYFLNGLVKETYVVKGNDENLKFSRSENFYEIKQLSNDNNELVTSSNLPVTFDVGGTEGRKSAAVLLMKTKNYLYELAPNPQLTTEEDMVYDSKGRVIEYINKGNLNTTADDYSSVISYHTTPTLIAKNMIHLPEYLTVKIGSVEMRKRKTTVDPANGNILSITAKIDNSNNAVTNLDYDTYGNLQNIYYPSNATGQHMSYQYTYDNDMHKYVIAIKDAFGYGSSASYDPHFDKVVETIDMAENRMQYEYDSFGRNTIIRGPKEIEASKPYTIKFEYFPNYADISNAGINLISTAFVPVALTRHFDVQNPMNDIETYTFMDGLGRPIQVKKDIEINSGTTQSPTPTEAMSFSGKVFYDEFGRAIKQFHPYYEVKNSSTNFKMNQYAATYVATTEYDELDRITKTIDPDNSTSTIQYSIANDVTGTLAIKTKSIVQQTGSVNVVTETFKDTAGRTISTKNVGPNGDIWTKFTYNALGELTSYTDAGAMVTSYSYDLLGRKTKLDQPDNGITHYEYDQAGNLTALQTANLAADTSLAPADRYVKYAYNFNRLEGITYPPIPSGNNISNVSYKFGAPGSGNDTGRLIYQEDATGTQSFAHGNMGEVIFNERTVVGPNIPTRIFDTYYTYDSWNRLLELDYPDGEAVTYNYNLGGNLLSMQGSFNMNITPYIKRIDYDYYEQRTYLKYGNNTENFYTYSPKLRRLETLNAKTSGQQNLFNNTYKYDKVGNVTSINNNAGPVNTSGLGGTFNHDFGYDSLNRLAWAEGNFTGSSAQAVDGKDYYSDYDLTMNYNNTHGITYKGQNHFKNSSQYMPNTFGNEYKYIPGTHKVQTITDNNSGYSESYDYDLNGNTVSKNNSNDETRQFLWDESNRLRVVADGKTMQHYIYDASGERVLKANSDVNDVYQNGIVVDQANFVLNSYTTYPSAFIVIDPQGIYTKHYYAGSQRIVSRIGESSITFDQGCLNCKTQQTKKVDEKAVRQTQIQDLQQRLRKKGFGLATFKKFEAVSYQEITKELNAEQQEEANRPPPPPANPMYFYHPDHLGTSTFLTDVNGNAYQFFLNLPFGETMAEQSGSQYYQTPYKFNGKELDDETGLYYYGARYYDPKASIWLSVDPLMEKYQGFNPYNYCMQNPVKLVDPDGKGPTDWVKKGNKWTWNEKITSRKQALKAGFSDYSAPGKIITTTSGNKVRLGENGAIHTGIIGIHSNVNSDAGLTDGHAWVSTSSVDGKIKNTYSLWPDNHPIFNGTDPSGTVSDVRTNVELDAGYATKSGNIDFYTYATADQMKSLENFANEYDEWGYTNTCASWSSKAFTTATGIEINADDYLGITGTPRQISNSINEKGANTPLKPDLNEKEDSSCFGGGY